MSTISRLLVLIGLLSLFHASVALISPKTPFALTNNPHRAYSAHEFSTLSFKTQYHSASLPLDIKLETLISVFLACFGLVLGSEQLRPVSWSAWAGQIEKKGGKEGNPFRGLEERVGFMDIRRERREFGEWARMNGGGK
jgi:membrane magnesium transporter 1